MALTTAQQVRLYIQDVPKVEQQTYYGDGLASAYTLPHAVITTASAYVQGDPLWSAVGGWSATGASFVSGRVIFDAPVSANSAYMVNYTYSVFSDDEIDHFVTAGGSVRGAQLEAVEVLLFDSLKRARWVSPDGTTFDDTKAQDTLLKMHSTLKDDLTQEAIGGGAVYSWGANQG